MRCRATALAIAAHAESGIESRSTGDMGRPVPLSEVDAVPAEAAADEDAGIARGEVISEASGWRDAVVGLLGVLVAGLVACRTGVPVSTDAAVEEGVAADGSQRILACSTEPKARPLENACIERDKL